MAIISTSLSSYIINVLIPFLDNLNWLSKNKTKQNLDSQDWKLVISLKQKGWHFSEVEKKL